MSYNNTQSELLFLIAKFFEQTPCTETYQVLKSELDKYQLLPKRRTWEGTTLPASFKDTALLYKNISSSSLPQLLFIALKEHNSANNSHFQSPFSVLVSARKVTPNLLRRTSVNAKPCHFLRGLTESNVFGSLNPRVAWPVSRYKSCVSSAKAFGHLAPIFCIVFDKRSEVVFTGSDDRLIKAWHLATGRLLATFRGHYLEISDIAISPDNALMASGSCDKMVRIWDLKSSANIAVLKGHSQAVSAVAFSPIYQFDGDRKVPPYYFYYLASGGADGVICLWRWRSFENSFVEKPIKFIEKSRAGVRIVSMAFSEGGYFLVAGSSDCAVRVYALAVTFEKVAELEGHTDEVDSLQFANSGMRFATASTDGTARIFHFEKQHWRQLIINCSQSLNRDDISLNRVQVCMIRWTCNDEFLVTSVSDKTVKIFDACNGQLVRELKGHRNQAFCISCSSFDPYLVVSGGYDGLIIVWDIRTGDQIFKYQNKAGANFDENAAIHALIISPDDSLAMAAADAYGNVLMFSFGQFRRHYANLPEQMFFNTDYRAITHNAAELPIDQQSGRPPHELPPPWLIDSEGAPYPVEFQQLVPGRERLTGTENVPEVVVDGEGYHEVTDRSIADATAGRPAQNRPPAWSEAKPLCRILDQSDIDNLIAKAAVVYDSEHDYFKEECHKKMPKQNGEDILNENHRLRSWDHRLHDGPTSTGDFYDRYTVPATNRLSTRALYDTDSDREGAGHSRNGALSADSTIQVERSRRTAIRRNYNENDEDDVDQSRRTRTRPVIRDDDDENANDAAGPSSSHSRSLRTTRRTRTSDDTLSRSRAVVDDDGSQGLAAYDNEDAASHASSDASVTDALQRFAPRLGASQNQPRNRSTRAIRNFEDDDEEPSASSDSDDVSDASSSSHSDGEWQPREKSNGSHRERRSTNHESRASRSRGHNFDVPSTSRGASSSKREKDESRSKRKSGKKSVSPLPNGRYELRDHKPAVSKDLIPSSSTSSRGVSAVSSSCNGLSTGSSRLRVKEEAVRVKEEAVFVEERPSERARRYKQRLTSKRRSPGRNGDTDASSSIPDSEYFENYQKQNGYVKTNGYGSSSSPTDRCQQIPPWMTQSSSTVRFPFVPQVGDEVVYIWRGHKLYIDAVLNHNVYAIRKSEQARLPYNEHDDILEEEICRVENLTIELLPESGVRLINVKLLILRTKDDPEPVELSFKFHDMPNVVDFVILRQWYDRSLLREWAVGDKFRAQIDGQWYFGAVLARKPLAPRCNFKVYQIMWDSEDDEDAVSPWDIEPLPKILRGASSTSAEGSSSGTDVAAYIPAETEWPPSGDRESACHRIVSCFDDVMGLSSAEPFNVPVDYTLYPNYLTMIAYPIDLSLIKERLHSGYYRRLEAIKWDIRHIAHNAETYNQPDSEIVRQAKLIVSILEEIIDDPDCVDAASKISNTRHSTRKRARVTYNEDYSSGDVTDEDEPSTSRKAGSSSSRQPPAKRPHRSTSTASSAPHWKTICQEILSRLYKNPNSNPFTSPVDLKQYPDYARAVRFPMDLGTIKRNLQKDVYSRPREFLKDVKLMFDNSRLYNTNSESAIYGMTTKLIDLFDAAVSEFADLLCDDDDSEIEEEVTKRGKASRRGTVVASSSSSSRTTRGSSTGTRLLYAESDDDDEEEDEPDEEYSHLRNQDRYRTRLNTGTIHYSNVREIEQAYDAMLAGSISRSRSQGHQNSHGNAHQPANSRLHYRRLQQAGGATSSVSAEGGSNLRRRVTRQMLTS